MTTQSSRMPDPVALHHRTFVGLAQARTVVNDCILAFDTGSLAVIDIDGLRRINSRWGSRIGDRVLESVEASLHQIGDDRVTLRLGGDQFIVVAPGSIDTTALAWAVFRAVGHARAGQWPRWAINVRCSAGLSRWPACGRTLPLLATCAQAGLQRMKDTGGNGWASCLHLQDRSGSASQAARSVSIFLPST
jgi:diguanylate cyclase (GGDEF)-like protein